jgi:vacuolar protein sorting-associated protein 41
VCGADFANLLIFFLDPILPRAVYNNVLEHMLHEIKQIHMKPEYGAEFLIDSGLDKVLLQAEEHFLNSLIAWGPVCVIEQHLKLLEYQSTLHPSYASSLKQLQKSLHHRQHQSAAGYLVFPAKGESVQPDHDCSDATTQHDNASLFDVQLIFSSIARTVSFVPAPTESMAPNLKMIEKVAEKKDARVSLVALAKIFMMMDNFEWSLRCYLAVGKLHALYSISTIQQDAVEMVASADLARKETDGHKLAYGYVLAFIEEHILQGCLVDPQFLDETFSIPPLLGLLQLVGLDMMSDFLMKHVVSSESQNGDQTQSTKEFVGERRSTLPLDIVAEHLSQYPEILHWYLHTLFVRKPEIYVRFFSTANPPEPVTRLHRTHLELHIRFAGRNKDSAKVLDRFESYRAVEATTPLLSFLRVSMTPAISSLLSTS